MKPSILTTFRISRLLPKTGKPASVPGTVEYLGNERDATVRIHSIVYGEKDFEEKNINALKESVSLDESQNVLWLNIIGVHDEKIIHDIGEIFSIHPLVLEDIANTTQSPKIEEYDNYLFVIIKMVYVRKDSREIVVEHVSLLVGQNYVISFQEKEGDILDGLRDRIRNNKGKIRKLGNDYLMYAIIDSVVDHYFSVLEHIGDEIENIEEQLLISANQNLLTKIYRLKQELVVLRRSVWPMREVVSTLQRTENTLIKENTFVYMRDLYDHSVQVVETVETFREMASGMLELYLSIQSNKMNEVMKVLTIFAAIFIPLTFLAGVYGMNFEYMPELKSKLAYPIWWGISIIMAGGMLIYFKRKKWM